MEQPRIHVEIPREYAAERAYAARVVLGDLLGYVPLVRTSDGDRVVIRVEGVGSGNSLTVADGLFSTPRSAWLTPSSVPGTPIVYRDVGAELPEARLVARRLPILFGNGHAGPLLEHDSRDDGATLHLDVFGTAFFALTRYEEVAADGVTRDRNGRFPASASLAYRAGFLDRPVADEHAEALRAALRRLWPRLPARPNLGALWLTHDVDRPFVARGKRLGEIVRNTAGDLVRRRSPALAARRLRAYARAGDDPGNTFDYLMDVAERHGHRSTFTFLAGGTAPEDGRYSLADPSIRAVLRRISERGHELGFHGSYGAYDDPERVRAEFATLRAAAAELGLDQPVWGGRQHFLRWDNPATWQAWSDAGLAFDSTVGFAEVPGFRSGSCRPHHVFNLVERRELPIVERPLTLMDTTAAQYLGLGPDETLACAHRLSQTCKAVGGTFVLLWHNDAVMTAGSRRLYERLVQALA
jgi:hypothetical protein